MTATAAGAALPFLPAALARTLYTTIRHCLSTRFRYRLSLCMNSWLFTTYHMTVYCPHIFINTNTLPPKQTSLIILTPMRSSCLKLFTLVLFTDFPYVFLIFLSNPVHLTSLDVSSARLHCSSKY